MGGDFELLCKHASSLFEDKALQWYWRFHRQNDDITWISLTRALKTNYKDDSTDFDILDEIRKCKQKPNESIDEFLDEISCMSDRLRIPMSESEYCETVIRNLKSEIRHELLHVEINNISQLRKEVRKHEKFMQEYKRKESREGKFRISEIVNRQFEEDLDKFDMEDDLCALKVLKCWNCDKIGHAFQDCMEVRRVFCYGCGLLATYKPTCPKCSAKKPGNDKTDVRRK